MKTEQLTLLTASLLVANVAAGWVKLEWGSSSPGAFPPDRFAVGKEHWKTLEEGTGAFLPGGGENKAGHLEKGHTRWAHQLGMGNVLWEMYHTTIPNLWENGPDDEGHGDIIATLRSFINRWVKVGVRWLQRLCAQAPVYVTAGAPALVLKLSHTAALTVIFEWFHQVSFL